MSNVTETVIHSEAIRVVGSAIYVDDKLFPMTIGDDVLAIRVSTGLLLVDLEHGIVVHLDASVVEITAANEQTIVDAAFWQIVGGE